VSVLLGLGKPRQATSKNIKYETARSFSWTRDGKILFLLYTPKGKKNCDKKEKEEKPNESMNNSGTSERKEKDAEKPNQKLARPIRHHVHVRGSALPPVALVLLPLPASPRAEGVIAFAVLFLSYLNYLWAIKKKRS